MFPKKICRLQFRHFLPLPPEPGLSCRIRIRCILKYCHWKNKLVHHNLHRSHQLSCLTSPARCQHISLKKTACSCSRLHTVYLCPSIPSPMRDWIPGVGRPRKAGLRDGVRRRSQDLRCDVHLTVILIVIKYSGRFLFMKKNRNNAFRNDSFFRKSLSKSGMMS